MKNKYFFAALSLLLLFVFIPVSSINANVTIIEDSCYETTNYYSCSNWTQYNYYFDCRGNNTYIVYQEMRECRDANGKVTIETRERAELYLSGECPWGGSGS